MLFYALILLVYILYCLHFYFNCNEKAKLVRKIPGPPDNFIVGNMFHILLNPVELFIMARKFAGQWDLYRFWAFNIGAINIYTPEYIEAIISTTKHNGKSHIYTFLSPWLRDGLLLSNGQKWHHRRKILTPAFHFNILRKFCITIGENTERMVEMIDVAGGLPIDVVHLLSNFTLNSICETAMGTRLSDEIADTGTSYKAAIYELGKLLILRVTRLHLHSNFWFNLTSFGKTQKQNLELVHNLTKRVIKERKEHIQKYGLDVDNNAEHEEQLFLNKKKKKTAMLDLLLIAEKEQLIDEAGIQEEVDTFMFEGHDTTAAGLTYCLMLLANDKHVQEQIFVELDEVFGDSQRLATIEDLSKLKYLECSIKESLRLYPPVPFISRQLTEEVTLGKYTIPAATHCHIHIYDLHRRADLYQEPIKFDPNRFLPENCTGRHPFSYIPFSAGPRNCIGQKFAMLEMKSAVSAILRRFELAPVTRPQNLKFATDLVLRNTEPVYVSFIRRSK